MTTNIYIDNILSNVSTDFKGVFSSNNIPLSLVKESCFNIVVNLSQKNEIGSHFICIIRHPKKVMYIDPLGGKCFIPEICTFLLMLQVPISYQKHAVQDINSNFCRFYTIYFCLLHNCKKDFNIKKYSLYKHNVIRNDKRVIDHICALIKKTLNYARSTSFSRLVARSPKRRQV